MAGPIVILSEPTVGSYGVVGALYHATLAAMGERPALLPYPIDRRPRVPRGAIVLHNTLGFRFAPLPGAFNIAVPFHEWSRYPAAWAERLNAFDEVWAASRHVASTLRRSGVTAPVRVAPPALDRDPPPLKRTWGRRGSFRFLFVGEPHFRKGHHLLIEGFCRAFPRGSATLTIKTSPECAWRAADARIRVIAERWPLARLWRLYAAHDAFVSASLGEGLGLGVAEAMLAGLPVAANRWGGHVDLLRRGGSVPIPHRVVPQPYCSRPDFFAPGQQCALSTPDAVAAAMHRLVDMSANERRRMAERARAHVLARFGFTAASRRLGAALAAARRAQGL